MPTGQYDRSHLRKKGKKKTATNGHAKGNGKSLRSRVLELSRENSDLRSQLQKAKAETHDIAAAALRTIDRTLSVQER